MGVPKKALFFLLMSVLTLGAIEGMARVAYWLVYDDSYEGESPFGLMDGDDAVEPGGPPTGTPASWIQHPYFGYSSSWPLHDLNAALPRRKREGEVLIGLLGGSVARGVTPLFEEAIDRYLIDNEIDLKPVVARLAWDGMKQPQQVMIVAWMLALGGEFDMIVNLDGHNEIEEVHGNASDGTFPFFPYLWNGMVGITTDQAGLVGRIRILRNEQQALLGWIRGSRWSWSAAVGLAARIRLEMIESEIRALHHELAESHGSYNLERHGPQGDYENEEQVRQAAMEVWHRSSVLLAGLAEQAGTEYYHFLQPNQHVPGGKPLTEWELANAYSTDGRRVSWKMTYPLLLDFGEKIRQQNVDYFDLTRIFADNRETLYRDKCCHFNRRGYELLADAMLRRILETTNVPGLKPR